MKRLPVTRPVRPVVVRPAAVRVQVRRTVAVATRTTVRVTRSR